MSERRWGGGISYDQMKVAPGETRRSHQQFLNREYRSLASFSERFVRRSTILLPNHFRRLIPQFEFTRVCARNHPLALPAHIPAIKRKWMLDRLISLRSFPSSSCCDILFHLSCSSCLPSHIVLRPRSSLENMYRVLHSSVDKNNQVWLLVMTGLSCPT